jgi:hypothetical protein
MMKCLPESDDFFTTALRNDALSRSRSLAPLSLAALLKWNLYRCAEMKFAAALLEFAAMLKNGIQSRLLKSRSQLS